MDRINTKDMLRRRHWNIEDGPNCVLCQAHCLEDITHLFFSCNFSCRIWNYLQIEWLPGNDMMQIAQQARRAFNKPFFADIVFTAWWHIWLLGNARIFRHERPYFARWKSGFVHDLTLLSHRIKPRFKEDLLRWIDFIPPWMGFFWTCNLPSWFLLLVDQFVLLYICSFNKMLWGFTPYSSQVQKKEEAQKHGQYAKESRPKSICIKY